MGVAIVGSTLALTSAYYFKKNTSLLAKESDTSADHVGQIRADLPEFKDDEIRRHDTLDKGVWVTYKDGVYDITQFIKAGNHPGGNKIYMAAGALLLLQEGF